MDKPIIVNVAGKAQHGKDTFAQYLVEYLYKEHGKKIQILHLADGVKEVARRVGWDGEKDQNGRALLQFIGTEWGRDQIGKDVWVREVKKKIHEDTDVVILPDTRFVNEISYWIEHGYIAKPVKVVRLDEAGNEWDNGMGDKLQNHSSETEIDNFPFPDVIHHQTLEDLKTLAKNFGKRLVK